MKNKGFTMIELLATITILGILSVVAIVGVSNLINRSEQEQISQFEETLKIAAQSYMQDNPSKLPKQIGDKRELTAKFLKEKKYLKKDLKTKKGDCMEASFVRVIKRTKTKYSYSAYLLCGKDKYIESKYNKPTIEIYFVDSLGTEIESYKEILQNLDKDTVYIKMTGGKDENKKRLKLEGYTIIVYATIDGKESEVYNSGTLSAGGEYEITHRKKLIDYMDVTKVTDFNVKVIAFNEKGESAEAESKRLYEDKKNPICEKILGSADKDDWINKEDYKEGKNRTITTNCKDIGSSGCQRASFARSWPNRDESSAEWGYIQTVDNAGNVSIDNDYLKDSCKDNKEIDNKCRVRVNVDIKTPTITVTSSQLNGTYVADDKTGNLVINSTAHKKNVNGWLNETNFANGATYTVTIEDDVHLESYVWETNPVNIKGTDNDDYNKFSQKNQDAIEKVTIPDVEDSNCGTREVSDIKISLKEEGMRQGRLIVKDKAGNKIQVTIKANIDRTIPPNKPTVYMKKWTNNSTKPNTLEKGKALTTSYTDNTWSRIYVFTYPTGGSDALSGFKRYEFTTTGTTKSETNKAANYRNVEADGISTIKWRTCDTAGNCTDYTSPNTIKIDTIAPTCSILAHKSKSKTDTTESNNPYKHNTWSNVAKVYSYPACSDSHSGCDSSKYKVKVVRGTSSSANTGTFSATKRGLESQGTTYHDWTIYDKVGNSRKCSRFTIKLDRTAPTCTVTKTKTGKTSGVTATFKCTDPLSGVDFCSKTHSGLKSSQTYSDASGDNRGSKDKVGNMGPCKVTVKSQRQERHKSRTWNSCKTSYKEEYGCTRYCCYRHGSKICGKEDCYGIGTWEGCKTRTVCTSEGWNSFGSYTNWKNVSSCSEGYYSNNSKYRDCRTIYY